jgi:hypothetical protein
MGPIAGFAAIACCVIATFMMLSIAISAAKKSPIEYN